jgi:hypothetical protein
MSRTQRQRLELSPRDLAVVRAVGEWQVLSGGQIQRWFYPIQSSRAGALRRTQRATQRLVDAGILDRLERRIGGVRAGSAGSCYVLGLNGQRLVRSEGSLRRPRRRLGLGAAYVDHALAAAEIAAQLHVQRRVGDLLRLDVVGEPGAWRNYLGRGGEPETLKPDLFAAFVTSAEPEMERRWFVEVDRGTESLPRIVAKCRRYLDYLATGQEQQRNGVFPLVLWSVRTLRRQQQIEGLVSGLPPPAGRLFACCLDTQAITTLKGGTT